MITGASVAAIPDAIFLRQASGLLKNSTQSPVSHSIDSHGVLGPGGGGKVTQTPPGATSIFQFKAMNPGIYIYHCATPMIPYHLSHGMYGLMVVEPPGGWPKVDREFYVMQGDIYLKEDPAQSGVHEAAVDKMVRETPDFVVFNGSVGSLAKDRALKAKVGETVRIFFGNAGPNAVSSFPVIGEIFDKVHPEGASETLSNVQSTLVPAGGATMVEFKTEVPGTYILVDHSLGRLQKGAAGFLDVEGAAESAGVQEHPRGQPSQWRPLIKDDPAARDAGRARSARIGATPARLGLRPRREARSAPHSL